MNTINIEIGLGRDAFATLAKSGLLAKLAAAKITVPQPQQMLLPTSDEVDGKALLAKFEELRTFANEIVDMLAAEMGNGEAMKADMEDMVSKEDMQAAIAAKQEELDALLAAAAEAEKTTDALTRERDALVREVEPLRANELADLRLEAAQFGVDAAKVKDAVDANAVRRLVAITKLGDSFGERVTVDKVETYKVNDAVVAGAYAGVRLALVAAPGTAPAVRDTNGPFSRVPALTLAPTTDATSPAAAGTGANSKPAPSFRDGVDAHG